MNFITALLISGGLHIAFMVAMMVLDLYVFNWYRRFDVAGPTTLGVQTSFFLSLPILYWVFG